MRADWTRPPRSLGAKASRATAQGRAECGNGEPRCKLAPAPGNNPLRLCEDHRAAYADRLLSKAHDAECKRCASIPGVPYVHTIGSICFGCGLSPGGTVCGPAHRTDAAANMRRTLTMFVRLARGGRLDLAALAPGTRHPAGVYLAALLSRAPDGMARQALIALAAALPASDIERIRPAHLAEHVLDD